MDLDDVEELVPLQPGSMHSSSMPPARPPTHARTHAPTCLQYHFMPHAPAYLKVAAIINYIQSLLSD